MSEPAETMLSWTPAAVEAWATVFAAVGAVLTAFFLTFDRLRPRPLQIVSRLEFSDTLLPDAARCAIYLASEIGELLTVNNVQAPVGYEIASAKGLTAAAMIKFDPADVRWTDRLRYLRKVARDDDGSEPIVRLFIRVAATEPGLFARLMGPRGLIVEGRLPFRKNGSFKLTPYWDGLNLERTVAAHTNKVKRLGQTPAS